MLPYNYIIAYKPTVCWLKIIKFRFIWQFRQVQHIYRVTCFHMAMGEKNEKFEIWKTHNILL